MYETLLRMPFLRLVIPIIAGIIASYYSDSLYLCLAGLLIGLISILIFYIFPSKRYSYRHLSGIGISCLLFSLSFINAQQNFTKIQWENTPQPHKYKIKIIDEPNPKPRSYQFTVQIESVETTQGDKLIGKKAMLYIAKDNLSEKLIAGNFLNINTVFKKIEDNIDDPALSGYNNYLKHKGYACIGYVSANNWEQISPKKTFLPDIQIMATLCKQFLLKELHQILPDKRQFGIASGLLFGDKKSIDSDLRASFTETGGAHILAVSGLHVSILYAILLFPFKFLGNTKRAKRIRQILVIPMVWTFTFITGLPPSAIRATTMLSLHGLADIIGKKGLSLNVVGASAFLMLWHNPLYLFDIGFQLSFSAVIAIITINPLLLKLYKAKNVVPHYIWSLLTVSTSAQIGTAPLSIYYFNLFPIVFLLTNLFIIPLTGILLVSLPIYLLLTCLFTLPELLLYPLRFILQLFISGVELIATIPYAAISDLSIGIIDIISLYIGFYVTTMLFIRKKIMYLYMLSLLALFQVIHYL